MWIHRSLALMLAGVLMRSPAAAQGDVVLEWNAIMLTTVSSQNPVDQARVAAIVQLAVFEAVNGIVGDYAPYRGTVTAPAGASPEAAAVAAAHRVLTRYLPDAQASLDERRAQSLAAIPDGAAKDEGIVAGVAAADALIALREHDGSQPPRFHVPSSTDPGVWQLTPSCATSGGGLFLHWRDVTPFAIKTGDQFRVPPPARLRSHTYQRALDEVRSVGAADSAERTPDRADVARFYAAVAATPLWNRVVTQIATMQGRSLSENARTLALVNVAIGDAVIAVFDSKYHYTLWRPETAINAADATAGTPAPEPPFKPFVTAPCHPSYPSAHAATAYAAREVLRRIYGRAGHAIELSVPSLPDVTLRYTRLAEITHDIDDARVFGGIHFRFDQHAGAWMGRRLGAYVSRHTLRPLHKSDVEETEDDEPEVATLPANLHLDPAFACVVRVMAARSPMFQRQLVRLAARPSVAVTVHPHRVDMPGSIRARTRFGRTNGELQDADVFVPRDETTVVPELIGHEIEHVIEQLDGVDLGRLLEVGASGVRSGPRPDQATQYVETDRAHQVGRTVAEEVGIVPPRCAGQA